MLIVSFTTIAIVLSPKLVGKFDSNSSMNTLALLYAHLEL
jgi:hypothetical protein